MTNKPWENVAPASELAENFGSYPFIQWVNRGDTLEPARDRGGFAMPMGQACLIDGELAIIKHGDGTMTDSLFRQELALAVVAQRFAWVKDGNRLAEYAEGARGKLQALVFTTEADGQILGPLVLTLKGTTSKALNELRKLHRQEVQALTGDSRTPSWFFFMRLRAGQPTMAGRQAQSLVTPLERAGSVTEADFIGAPMVETINAYASDIQRWAGAWKAQGANGEEEMAGGIEAENGGPPAVSLSVAQALALRLPRSQRYGDNATLQQVFEAGDQDVLRFLQGQAVQNPQLAAGAGLLLQEMSQQPPADEIPF